MGGYKRCPKCNTPVNGKEVPCQYCSKPFYTMRKAKYCSKSCKVMAYRKRKAHTS